MNANEIHVIYGNNYRQMTGEILEKAGLANELCPDMRIGLKPNLVVAKRASEGATTSPVIVEGVIDFLRSHGIQDISIMEGSWVGDDTKRAYRICGYTELAAKYQIPLYDLKEDGFTVQRVAELDIKVCRKPQDVDYLINLPVLKAHCQTLFTCAIKNLKGCIPDSEKRRFHSLGLMKPIGYLAKALTPHFTLVDAIAGDLTFEEGGNPVQMDRLIAGKDPVLVDAYAASLLGYKSADIEYIGIAEQIGAGSADLGKALIREYNEGLKKGNEFKPSPKAARLARKVTAQEACSACYGGLIHALQRLDDAGRLSLLRQPLYIGQGFRGQTGLAGLGIGQCAKGCDQYIAGCPPTAKSIVEFLEENMV
ncbi:MAG: DUF362 domain-containing protein [Negativicutes bacterium]|nr:DUF362 domain-containing protein [Negativicutes bacterium]